MASFNYLWANRAKFPFQSLQFYRAWGKRLFSINDLIQRNQHRTKLIRQGARIAASAEIGELKADGPKNRLTIGNLSFLGRVTLALHDEIIIGERVCINDGVQILTASHNVLDPEWKHVKSKIVIDDYAWIATGAILLPGVHIGRGAVVGAGAVVSKSVAPGEIVSGNPARTMPKKRCPDLDYNPCAFLAANRAWLIG